MSIKHWFQPSTTSRQHGPRFAEPLAPQEALDVLLYEFPQLFIPDLILEADRKGGEIALASFKRRHVFGPMSCFGMDSDGVDELWGMCAHRYGHEPDNTKLDELVEQVLNDVPLLVLERGDDPDDYKDWRAGNRFSIVEVINLLAAIREVRWLGSQTVENQYVDRVEIYEAQVVDGFIDLANKLAERITAPLPPPRADTAAGVFGIMRGHECGDADAVLTATRSGSTSHRMWIDPMHPLSQPIYPWFGDWNPAYLVEAAGKQVREAFLDLLNAVGDAEVQLRIPETAARQL